MPAAAATISAGYILTVNPDMVPSEMLPSLIDALADLEPVLLDRVGTYLYKAEEQNFDDRGATFGAPWDKLRPATIREKERLGFPDQPLVRTGHLQAALGESVNLSPNSISVGINADSVPYAGYQNAHRLLISITPQMVEDIQQILEDWAESLGVPPGAVQFNPV